MITPSTHIMFQGQAADALAFYAKTVPGFEITHQHLYGSENTAMAGQVQRADVDLAGHRLTVIDSPPVHDFDLTPSMSLYLTFADPSPLRDFFKALAQGGQTMMPLNTYDFSPLFGWVKDPFGLSWQLGLAAEDTE